MQSGLDVSETQYDMMAKVITEAGFGGLEKLSANGHRAEPRDIWKARRFIEEHSNEHVSLRKVADVAGINATHLSEKFKQVTGVKFVDYVARTRFERAKKLLEHAEFRVSEIAFAVGFQSLSQFNRVFKKLSGKSPSEYRTIHAHRNRH